MLMVGCWQVFTKISNKRENIIMRIDQLKEVDVSLRDDGILEMEQGNKSFKLPFTKLMHYIKTKLSLSKVAYTGNYLDLDNTPSVRVATPTTLGVIKVGSNLTISPDGRLDSNPDLQVNADWAETEQGSRAYIFNKPDLSVFATTTYVDSQDEYVLGTSREYTDTSLQESKDYTDSKSSDTLQTSKDYTDSQITTSEGSMQAYTDGEIASLSGEVDGKLQVMDGRIADVEDLLDDGYVVSVDGQNGVVDLSGSYEHKRKNNLSATTPPTVDNDSSEGYEVLSRWVDTSGAGDIYILLDATVGAANWQSSTLTLEDLGSAATADVGTTPNTLPTNATVDSKLSAGLDTKVDKVSGKGLSDENFTIEEKGKLAVAIIEGDSRLTDAREWIAPTVTKAEAESGVGSERKAWTVERVWEATEAWWDKGENKTKLNGIEDGATKNATDAELRDRATHTGTQPISSVEGLQTALDGKANDSDLPDFSTLATKQELTTLDNSLAIVAKTGEYEDLLNKPTLGTASTVDIDYFASNTDELPEGAINKYVTQAEKDKLAGLESSHFKGLYTTEAELEDAHPSAVAGDYADVDAGLGVNVERYIWDVTDSHWVQQGSDTGGSITAPEVKVLYESNPDTNAFTDAEKSQLAGVQGKLNQKLNIVGRNPYLQSNQELKLDLRSAGSEQVSIQALAGWTPKWALGNLIFGSEDVVLSADSHNSRIVLSGSSVSFDKPLYVSGSKVPTISELGTAAFGNLQETPTSKTSGIVLRRGDFGLGTSIILNSSGKFADLRYSGFVKAQSSSNQPTDAPIGLSGTAAISLEGTAGGVWKVAVGMKSGTPTMFLGDDNINSQGWIELYHTGNFSAANFVNTTAAQTIGGTKTFSLSPIVPTPTANMGAANKQYVDSKVSEPSYGLVARGSSGAIVSNNGQDFQGNYVVRSANSSTTNQVGAGSVALGATTAATGAGTISIGDTAVSIGTGSIAIGRGSRTNSAHIGSVAIGDGSATSKRDQTAFSSLDASTHLAATPRLLSGVATPVVAQDAANKEYVDKKSTVLNIVTKPSNTTTLQASDSGSTLVFTTSTPLCIISNLSSDLGGAQIGSKFDILYTNLTGTLTFSASNGAIIKSRGLTISGVGAATIIKLTSDEYLIIGALEE